MDIIVYFDSLQRSIRQNHNIGVLEHPVVAQAFDAYRGLFRAQVFFWDGSRLLIDEVIDTEAGYPEILRYSYAYLQQNTNVFRYDNAPHHPELATFPHHKHIGPNEIPIAAERPTLSQVFKEIERILLL
ncbi:MAG TPA: hypothetical protein G4N96_13475 [Chloroflexi bacterium]|nr:hypothetical protein [Chloroflexota bacterium]